MDQEDYDFQVRMLVNVKIQAKNFKEANEIALEIKEDFENEWVAKVIRIDLFKSLLNKRGVNNGLADNQAEENRCQT